MLFEPSDLELEQLLHSCWDDQPVTAPLEPDDEIFGPFLERREVVMPPNYFPYAPGVLLAGPRMLKLAGCKPRVSCPDGWERRNPGVYRRYPGWNEFDTLQVRQSGDWRTKRWAVERVDYSTGKLRAALVFAIDNVPVWAQSRREAMFLAEFYRKDHAHLLVGCCWKNPYLQ
jgi:hypothetical protein